MNADLAAPLAPGASATVRVSGPAGRLETLWAMPRAGDGEALAPGEPPRGLCVVCHPHPLFGGTLSNKVVYTLASSALKAGLATARFNFRGVGKSEGLHDESRGETDDALAVADWLRRQLGAELPLTLAGFSFGAYVALKAASRTPAQRLVTISPPFGRIVSASGEAAPARPDCAWLALHSHDDEVVSFADTQAALTAYQPSPRLVEFDGAGHFWHGRLIEMAQVVLPFLQGRT